MNNPLGSKSTNSAHPILSIDLNIMLDLNAKDMHQDQDARADTHQADLNVKVDTNQVDLVAKVDILQADLVVKVDTLQVDLVAKVDTLQADHDAMVLILQADLDVKALVIHQADHAVKVDTHQADLDEMDLILQADHDAKDLTSQADRGAKDPILQVDHNVKADIRPDLDVKASALQYAPLFQEKMLKANHEKHILQMVKDLHGKNLLVRHLSKNSENSNLLKKVLNPRNPLTPAIAKAFAPILTSKVGEKNDLVTNTGLFSKKRSSDLKNSKSGSRSL